MLSPSNPLEIKKKISRRWNLWDFLVQKEHKKFGASCVTCSINYRREISLAIQLTIVTTNFDWRRRNYTCYENKYWKSESERLTFFNFKWIGDWKSGNFRLTQTTSWVEAAGAKVAEKEKVFICCWLRNSEMTFENCFLIFWSERVRIVDARVTQAVCCCFCCWQSVESESDPIALLKILKD